MECGALKERAKGVVKRHYALLVAACLIAAMLGVEFTGSLSLVTMSSLDQAQQTEGDQIATTVGGAANGDVDLYSALLDIFQRAGAGEDAPEQSDGPLGQVFGTSRGVFASLVNGAASGKFLAILIVGLHSVAKSGSGAVMLLIGLALVFHFLVWMFVKRNYLVVLRRLTLESQHYDKTPFSRFRFLFKNRRWLNTAVTLMLTSFFHFLWSLTVVGGIIKYYSYYMVPYILAEDPSIRPLEAITLSRRMMKGHKWECFVNQITFLGWHILSVLTFGLSQLFFSAPYEAAFFGAWYGELRGQAKAAGVEGAELLNDGRLYEHPSREALEGAYPDIETLRAADLSDPISRDRGFRHFVAVNFGVSLYSGKLEEEFNEKSILRQRAAAYEDVLEGRAYPARLFPRPAKEKRSKAVHLNYDRHYAITSLILMYFIFAVFGWVWEVTIGFVQGGVFINRGVLHGPWLPIYGTGATIILVLLARFRKKPFAEFVLAIVLSGCVEYFTGWYLEMTHGGLKWWDYSGYFLNINGRVCAEGLLTFSIAGVVVVYYLGPVLDQALRKLKPWLAVTLSAVLLTVFMADNLYSSAHPNTGDGITDVTASVAVETAERQNL